MYVSWVSTLRYALERVPLNWNRFVTSPTLWRHPREIGCFRFRSSFRCQSRASPTLDESGDPVRRSLWGLLGPRFRGDDTRLFDSTRTKHALECEHVQH